MDKKEILKGLRCVGQIRCSRKEQKRLSVPQQQAWLRDEAEKLGMIYVDEIQEAISASQIKKRPDLERLLERKRTLNDFDVIIVQDLSRLTRGGAKHGMRWYYRFDEAGLKLVSLEDGLIDSDEKIAEAVRKFQEARAQAKMTAKIMRRGALDARKSGRLIYTYKNPFALDKLISTAEKVPQFVIRNRPDGTQVKLSPDGQTVLQEFPKIDHAEGNRHYVRQYGEFASLVPGDPEHVKVVNYIYRRRYVDGIAINSIARELNDSGAPNPSCKGWSYPTVHRVLHNPVYLGIGIGDRESLAIFYKNGEFPIPVSDVPAYGKRWRPEEDWFYQRFPAIDGMITLEPDLIEKIKQIQFAELRRRISAVPRKRGGNRHVKSKFVLSHILKEKGTDIPLTGTLMSRQDENRRYYMITRARCRPVTYDARRRCIFAERVERPAIAAVKDVLANLGDLESKIRAAIASETADLTASTSQESAYRNKRDDLVSQIDYWVRQIGFLGAAEVEKRTESLKKEVANLNAKLVQITAVKSQSKTYRDTSAEVRAALEHIHTVFDDLKPEYVKKVLEIIIGKMEIDMHSGHVEMEFRLPSWAIENPSLLSACLEEQSLDEMFHQTYVAWSVPLGTHAFDYKFGGVCGKAWRYRNLPPDEGMTYRNAA